MRDLDCGRVRSLYVAGLRVAGCLSRGLGPRRTGREYRAHLFLGREDTASGKEGTEEEDPDGGDGTRSDGGSMHGISFRDDEGR